MSQRTPPAKKLKRFKKGSAEMNGTPATSIPDPSTLPEASANGTHPPSAAQPTDPQAEPPVDLEATLVPKPVAQAAPAEPPKPTNSKAKSFMELLKELKAWFSEQFNELSSLVGLHTEKIQSQGERLGSVEAAAAGLETRLAQEEAATKRLKSEFDGLTGSLKNLEATVKAASEDNIITSEERKTIATRFKEMREAIAKIK